jgi:hypothetical protein
MPMLNATSPMAIRIASAGRTDRPRRSVGENSQALPAPTDRTGEHDPLGRPVGHPLRFAGHSRQDRCDGLGHGHVPLTEPEGAVVDTSFRVRLEPAGSHRRTPLRVAADHQAGLQVQKDGGREQRRPVEEQGHRRLPGAAEHAGGVGRTKVDTQNRTMHPRTVTPGRPVEHHRTAAGRRERAMSRGRAPPDSTAPP